MPGRLLWNRNTSLWTGLIQATITLAVAFGAHATPEQVGAVNVFVLAVAAVLNQQAAGHEVRAKENEVRNGNGQRLDSDGDKDLRPGPG